MDIIFVVEQLNVGGIATTNLRWAAALVKQGYKVAIFCQKQAGNYLQQVPAGVHVEVANASRAMFSAPQLYRFLRKHPDAVVISSAYTSVFACFLKPRRMKSWIIVPSSPVLNRQMALQNKRASRVSPVHMLYRLAIQRADLISAVSNGVAREVESWVGLPEKSVHTLYNPAYTPDFEACAAHPVPHPWLDDDQLITFVSCGSLA